MTTTLRPARYTPSKRDTETPIVRFAREMLHFDLWPRQVTILGEAYRSGARTIVLRLGRRSGKSRIAALIAVFEAVVNASTHLASVPPGERPLVAVLANSQDQGRQVFAMIVHFLQAPGLRDLVVGEPSRYQLSLTTGIDIEVLPASGRSARGRTICCAVLDELAHAVDGEGRLLSPQAASELWQAIEPATLQFAAGKVVCISTPKYAAGLFHRLCQLAETGQHPGLWSYAAATAEVNPTIPASEFAAAQAMDPDLYRREWLAEFDATTGALYDADLIESAVVRRPPLDPLPGTRYVVSTDPAYSADAWACVVGHEDHGRLIVDRSLAWQGTRAKPLDHAAILGSIADLSRAFRNAVVRTDQYAAQAVIGGLRERGVYVDGFV